jgi:transposase
VFVSEPLFERDQLAGLLDGGLSVEAIGRRVGRHPSTVAYWMAKYGLEAPLREKYAGKGGLDREELKNLVDEGLSIAEIADRLGRTSATVRHWLRRFDLSTRATVRLRAVQDAKARGVETVTLTCPHHGETTFVLDVGGFYRCRRCRADRVSRRRRATKQILVDEAGGCCGICGYCRCVAALQFHHIDPASKRLHLSNNGRTVALKELRAEAMKCVLLCANCHAEVEAGVTKLPLQFAGDTGEGDTSPP